MTAQNLFKEDLGLRRYDLDWVRIAAFLLLILYHVGMYYVTWDWHVKSPDASGNIEPLMMLTSPWRLSLLFLVSGVATAYLLARQGAVGFMGQRSTRLLIPLVFGMLVIVPPQSYLEVVEKLRYTGSFAEFYRLYITGFHGFCRGGDCLIMPTWNHLWFVAYLWLYTAVLYAAVRLAPPVIPWLRRIAEKRLSGLGVLLWPIAYLVAIRLSLAPRFPATHALVGDWYNHAMYFGVFLLGFSLAGARAAWGALERARWLTLGLAIVGWAFVAAYFAAYSDDAAVPPMALRLFQRGVYGAEQWLAIAAAVGFAHRHLTQDSAARRYLTTAIFPVYILHQTIIVVVAHALKPSHLYPPVEGVLLVLVTAAACFMSYEAIRRVRLLRPLFGLDAGINAAAARRRAPELVPQDIN
ncbi:MAG TPA: acyltransferase family protein [Steroidobacteraceae bacterium]|jgi:peptidoglycan/LPS O-acetylase OafA/YrhL|nr:acyltransferase family protein [Steroidobacteraceae bacterium]